MLGYGGVFAAEFFRYSRHPVADVVRLPVLDGLFDAIFDPLRTDQGGTPISVAEASSIAPLEDGSSCPASRSDRAGQVACAVFVLGNLVGTTLTHELGHSLGLADPHGPNYHDLGDRPARLMEAGDARPFEERAELAGQGPGLFCDSEMSYLLSILPFSSAASSAIARPPCTP
jgi:hypothetical protein